MMAETELLNRHEIEQHIEREEWVRAKAALDEFWRRQPGAATASYVNACAARLRPHLAVTSCRLAILRSFTVEPLLPILRAAAFQGGIDLRVSVGPFNVFAQEILDENSALYRADLDVVILAAQTRDYLPDLWESYTDSSSAVFAAACDHVLAELNQWITALRERSNAALIIHNFEQPPEPGAGVRDAQTNESQTAAITRMNRQVRELAAKHKSVYILDYDALVARHGRARWSDERKWLSARMPIRAQFHPELCREWLRLLHPITGKIGKVLVTDLDNTIWRGVLGEDGRTGIEFGREYPGALYRAVQRAMLDFRNRGILLAIASKNNHDEAIEALSHPDMLLKPEHFSAMRINWNDKPGNLRAIAAELNVGADSLVFLDDNPAERQQMRLELPEVTVVELPPDPAEYAAVLRATPHLERLDVSNEDRRRAEYYSQQRLRVTLSQGASSVEDYYRSLEQELDIFAADDETITRIAQLTQKTNQFNTTTHRYSEAEIAGLTATPGWDVYAARARDRFGDSGLVGVMITCSRESACRIDSFLLSCRVIGRTIESAMLAFLAAEGRRRGVETLQAWFYPTAKNLPAADLYQKHQFNLIAQENGATLWELRLRDQEVACPPWIKLRATKEPSARAAIHS